MHRGHRIGWASILAGVALLLGPAQALASPETHPGGSPTTTLDVNPNDGDNLASPASLAVTGSGFGNGMGLDLFQCSAELASCSNLLNTTISNPAGTFSTTVNVTRVFTRSTGGTVDCMMTRCVVFAETHNGQFFASHHISFEPSRPTLTGSTPASPANDNAPEILGTAVAGSTVNLFTDSSCSGSPVATGSAAQFASPGITVSVPDNSTTTFFARVVAGGGGTSACSTSSVTYVEDSTIPPSDPTDPGGGGGTGGDTDPPETTITKEPPNRSDRERVKFKFSSDEPGATFACKVDKKPFKPCTSPRKVKVKEGKHKFLVRAIDPAGNVDATPDKDKFKIVR